LDVQIHEESKYLDVPFHKALLVLVVPVQLTPM